MSKPNPIPAPRAFKFAAPRAASFGVDRTQGILTNVALITAGVEALGHGIFIDDKTVSTCADVLAAKDNRFKAAISHLSWGDYWDGETDRVMEFPGWFSGVAVKGAQLVAAKLEFYDTFKADQPRLFARLLEMAEKTPDLFGISLEPWGYLVFVGEDGVEYSERPKDLPLKYEGLPALRVTALTYGAIVDDPAANPGGFFATLSRKFPASKLAATLARMFADEQSELAATQRLAAVAAPASLGTPKPVGAGGLVNSAASSEPASSSPLVMKEILNSIKAEFGADKAKFSQAMSLFGENPEITFEALKAKMVSTDLAATQQQVTTLTARNTELTTQVTTLTAERDEWKGKFDALKGSGAGQEVALGVPNAGGVQDNPWAAGSVNLSRQAELSKTNPALAKQLKAAASQPAATAQK